MQGRSWAPKLPHACSQPRLTRLCLRFLMEIFCLAEASNCDTGCTSGHPVQWLQTQRDASTMSVLSRGGTNMLWSLRKMPFQGDPYTSSIEQMSSAFLHLLQERALLIYCLYNCLYFVPSSGSTCSFHKASFKNVMIFTHKATHTTA